MMLVNWLRRLLIVCRFRKGELKHEPKKIILLLRNNRSLKRLAIKKWNDLIWATNGHFIIRLSNYTGNTNITIKRQNNCDADDCRNHNYTCDLKFYGEIKKCKHYKKDEKEYKISNEHMAVGRILSKVRLITNEIKFSCCKKSRNPKMISIYTNEILPGDAEEIKFNKFYMDIFTNNFTDIKIFNNSDREPAFIKAADELIGCLMPVWME